MCSQCVAGQGKSKMAGHGILIQFIKKRYFSSLLDFLIVEIDCNFLSAYFKFRERVEKFARQIPAAYSLAIGPKGGTPD